MVVITVWGAGGSVAGDVDVGIVVFGGCSYGAFRAYNCCLNGGF